MKYALCVGINDYPGYDSDLEKCINDAKNWGKFFTSIGFSVEYIFNSNATLQKVTDKLKAMIVASESGDHLVFQYSGHGSYQLDLNDDEADGWDEVICLYDADWVDDDFRDILNTVPKDVSMTIILDCCFGGTGTRVRVKHKKKFRPPKTKAPEGMGRRKGFLMLADEDMPEVVMSACGEDEVSYEDENGGVFTTHALEILRHQYSDYFNFSEDIQDVLPTREYPQTPQVEGSTINKAKIMFVDKEDSQPAPEPDPIPTPDPEPEPDPEPAPEPEPSVLDWCGFRRMRKWLLIRKRNRMKRSKNGKR